MRTLSRDDYLASRKAWDEGDFGPQWKRYRHQAAMRGMAFPPAGSALDPWDADQMSQRAIIARAIEDTPSLLADCIGQSSSWSQVVDRLTRSLNHWREQQRIEEREPDDEDRLTDSQATRLLADILERIHGSTVT